MFTFVQTHIRSGSDSIRVSLRLAARVCAGFALALALLPITPARAALPVRISGEMVTAGDVENYAINSLSTRVVFIASRQTAGVSELYSVPVGGGTITKLSAAGSTVSTFKISPNGLLVAYSSYSPTRQLLFVPIDGSSAPVSLSGSIVGSAATLSFAWAPTSDRVVFLTDKTTASVNELYSIGLTLGSMVTKISGTLVTGGDVINGFRISPDGVRVIFQADRDVDGVFELYSVAPTGGTVTKISGPLVAGGNVGTAQFLISADSARVVFVADKDVDNRTELYSVAIAGGAVTKISGTLQASGNVTAAFSNPAFFISADSVRVVFIADKDSDEVFELYSVGITGGTVTKVSGVMATGADASIFRISPDSARVVFVADKDVAGVVELYSAPIAGGAVVKLSGVLVAGGAVNTNFVISPNGQRVVFSADKETDDVFELYSVPSAGGAVTRISGPMVTGGVVLSDFYASPDGARVLFIANKDRFDLVEVYSAPIAGGDVTKLSGSSVPGGYVYDVQISQNSAWVVFYGDKETDEVFELFSVGIVGGGSVLDIDGDGAVLPTTDVLMLARWHLGIRGAALFGGITFPVGATRTTAVVIEDHLRRLSETPMGW